MVPDKTTARRTLSYANEVGVGTQVVSFEAPVTAEQAGDVAALLERTSGDGDGTSARFSVAEDGYSLRLAFPGEAWRHPQSLQSASFAGLLVSAAVLDGAPLTVHVSDGALESKQTLRIDLTQADIFFYRGEALVLQDRNVEAIDQFRRAVELRPKETRYLLRYGEALFVEWRDAEAERAIRTALELEPNNARAHFLLGELTFQQGQLEAALPFYRRAVELEPDFARGHEMLASTTTCSAVTTRPSSITNVRLSSHRAPRDTTSWESRIATRSSSSKPSHGSGPESSFSPTTRFFIATWRALSWTPVEAISPGLSFRGRSSSTVAPWRASPKTPTSTLVSAS